MLHLGACAFPQNSFCLCFFTGLRTSEQKAIKSITPVEELSVLLDLSHPSSFFLRSHAVDAFLTQTERGREEEEEEIERGGKKGVTLQSNKPSSQPTTHS